MRENRLKFGARREYLCAGGCDAAVRRCASGNGRTSSSSLSLSLSLSEVVLFSRHPNETGDKICSQISLTARWAPGFPEQTWRALFKPLGCLESCGRPSSSSSASSSSSSPICWACVLPRKLITLRFCYLSNSGLIETGATWINYPSLSREIGQYHLLPELNVPAAALWTSCTSGPLSLQHH